MEKFCYRCGALEEEKGPLVEGLCRDCFLDENPLIRAPDEIELEICDRCGAYFFENDWHDVEGVLGPEYLEAAKELALSKIEVLQRGPSGNRYVDFDESEGVSADLEADYSSPEAITVGVEVFAEFFDFQEKPFEQAEIRVKLIRTTCDVCEKRASGYYEAVLQVRGEGRISDEKISEIFQALRDKAMEIQERSRDDFVSGFEEKHGGVNFYTSSAGLARELARFLKKEYGAGMDESAELVGQTEDGEEKYRVTVIARLPF